jgi:hypothetical protein
LIFQSRLTAYLQESMIHRVEGDNHDP